MSEPVRPEESVPSPGRLAVVNDFLVTYLDSIDGDLLQYLDDGEELSVVVVKRA